MTGTVIDLLDAIRAHLTGFAVAVPCTVHASIHGREITAQLPAPDAAALAAGLLAWADTLTDPAGEMWRIPDGHRVHLSVCGQLPGGIAVRVYGGIPHTERGLGAGLAPNGRTPLRLGVLRQVADLGQVTGQ